MDTVDKVLALAIVIILLGILIVATTARAELPPTPATRQQFYETDANGNILIPGYAEVFIRSVGGGPDRDLMESAEVSERCKESYAAWSHRVGPQTVICMIPLTADELGELEP